MRSDFHDPAFDHSLCSVTIYFSRTMRRYSTPACNTVFLASDIPEKKSSPGNGRRPGANSQYPKGLRHRHDRCEMTPRSRRDERPRVLVHEPLVTNDIPALLNFRLPPDRRGLLHLMGRGQDLYAGS